MSSSSHLHVCFKIMSHICWATKYSYCFHKKVNDKVYSSSISASSKHRWSSSLAFGELHNFGNIKLNQFARLSTLVMHVQNIQSHDSVITLTFVWTVWTWAHFNWRLKSFRKKKHFYLINFLHGPYQLAGWQINPKDMKVASICSCNSPQENNFPQNQAFL